MSKKQSNYSVGKGKGFVVIPDDTIVSTEYKSLSLATRAVYVAMLTDFIRGKGNPYNEITISHSRLEETSKVFNYRRLHSIKEGFIPRRY